MTINKDLHNQVSVGVAIALTAVDNGEDVVGAVIDRQGNEGLELIFQVGEYTDGSVTPLIEEGDDPGLSDAWPVDDADLLGTEAAAALSAAGVSNVGYIGNKRYVRATAVTAAGSTLSVGCTAIKYGLRIANVV